MAKSLKDANWGTGGLACFVAAAFTFASFLLTGRASSPHGHAVKGWGALLGTVFLVALGTVSIGVWFVLRRRRKR